MKTHLTLLTCMLMLCFGALAQEVANAETETEEEPKGFILRRKAIVVGGSYTHVEIKRAIMNDQYSSAFPLKPSKAICLGVDLNMQLPSLSKRLSIASGLYFNSYNAEGGYNFHSTRFDYYNNRIEYYDVVQIKVSAGYFMIPAMLRVDFSKRKVVPYLKVGPNVALLLFADNIHYAYHSGQNGDKEVRSDYKPPTRPIGVGASGALGIQFPLSVKHDGILEIGYQVNNGFAPKALASQVNQTATVLVGATF